MSGNDLHDVASRRGRPQQEYVAMHAQPNPYAGVGPAGRRHVSRQPVLPLGYVGNADRRRMLVPWFERDLSAWEARAGHRVTIRAAGADGTGTTWRVDGARIASTALSDVVYGRMDLESAMAA